jgi:hypothetical protein
MRPHGPAGNVPPPGEGCNPRHGETRTGRLRNAQSAYLVHRTRPPRQLRELPVYVERLGSTKDEIVVTAAELRKEMGDVEFEKVPTGALGLYTYYERLA